MDTGSAGSQTARLPRDGGPVGSRDAHARPAYHLGFTGQGVAPQPWIARKVIANRSSSSSLNRE